MADAQLSAELVATRAYAERAATNIRRLTGPHGGKGAGFRSLGGAWADTTTSPERLMVTVRGGLAEFERDLSGRARAKAASVRMGRKPKLAPQQW